MTHKFTHVESSIGGKIMQKFRGGGRLQNTELQKVGPPVHRVIDAHVSGHW